MRIVYKCRLCGKEYSNTSCGEDTALFVLDNLCLTDRVSLHGTNLSRYDVHICENGKIKKFGFADLLGIEADKGGGE